MRYFFLKKKKTKQNKAPQYKLFLVRILPCPQYTRYGQHNTSRKICGCVSTQERLAALWFGYQQKRTDRTLTFNEP
jgi:hypothetical protein